MGAAFFFGLVEQLLVRPAGGLAGDASGLADCALLMHRPAGHHHHQAKLALNGFGAAIHHLQRKSAILTGFIGVGPGIGVGRW